MGPNGSVLAEGTLFADSWQNLVLRKWDWGEQDEVG